MKNPIILTTILSLFLFGCGQNEKSTTSTTTTEVKTTETVKTTDTSGDKQQIQDLIRKVLIWADAQKGFELAPGVAKEKDSVYSAFDMQKLKANMDKLKATNYFSATFIENYNQIILTLDKKLKANEFGKWYKGELPPFTFANDVDPWCDCQDNLSWNLVEAVVVNLNDRKGDLTWKWGKAELAKSDDTWKTFEYKFKVEKENGIWKVSYLEGFDFKDSTRKDGI